jgi:AraC-like DNA-binding protein
VNLSERVIHWNLKPAPKLLCANPLNSEGIDFRGFSIGGEGSFDYDCSVLQIVAIGDNSLRVRSAKSLEFVNSRARGSARVCLPGERVTADFLGIYLTPFSIERIFERPFHVSDFNSGEETSQIIFYLLSAIRADVIQGSPAGPTFAQSVVISLLHYLNQPTGTLLPRLARRGLSRKQLRTLQELIDAEFSTELNLERLSTEVGLSPGYLSRAFKTSTGITPHQYILRIRVDRAKKLIKSGSWIRRRQSHDFSFLEGNRKAAVSFSQQVAPKTRP